MKKVTLIQLFLGLIDAQTNGAIGDTLWMGAGHGSTIWEALIDELPELQNNEAVLTAFYNGDDSQMTEALLVLLSQEKGKV